MKNFISTCASWICDILFPPVCIHCAKTIPNQKNLLCQNCFDHIQTYSACICPACGGRVPDISKRCHPKEPYLLAAATRYEEPMPSLIRFFKYGKVYTLETFLSALCCAYLRSTSIPVREYTFVPIPLHAWKKRVRGFNQSEVLARHMAEYFGCPCELLLKRVRATRPQAHMPFEKRKKNVRGCFGVVWKNTQSIRGKKIILVDDVATTGSTLHEAAQVLRTHGAKSIICFVVSKT